MDAWTKELAKREPEAAQIITEREAENAKLREANQILKTERSELERLRAENERLRAALAVVRDRFFPASQPERDRDLHWQLVNDALSEK